MNDLDKIKLLDDAFKRIINAVEKGRSATIEDKKQLPLLAEELIWRHWCWVRKLDCEKDYYGRFVDLLKYIDSEDWMEQAHAYINNLKFYDDSRPYGKAASFLVKYYMAWEAAKATLKLENFGLPHPYQPFIWLLEKGAFMFDYEYVTFYAGPGARGIQTIDKEYFFTNGPFVKEDSEGNLSFPKIGLANGI